MEGKPTPVVGVPVAPLAAIGRSRTERAVADALATLARWSRVAPDLSVDDMRARIRQTLHGVDRDVAIKLETVVHALLELEHSRARLVEADESRDRLRELLRERTNALAVQTRITRSADKQSSPALELATQWKPCAGVSGDFWASYDLRDGRVAVILGDALGHGAGAALQCGVARGACDLIVRRVDPRQIRAGVMLAELNAALRDTGAVDTEMTAVVAILDPASGELTVASAGHPLPLLVPARDVDGDICSVGAIGPGLGSEAAPQYHADSVALGGGDMVVLFSDGLLDCGDGRTAFGVRRLRRTLESLRDTEPGVVRDQLWLRLKALRNHAPLTDDVTYVVARFRGSGPT